MADILYIYPNKRKKKSFENHREEILRNGLDAAVGGGPDGKRNPKNKYDLSPSKNSQDKLEEKFMKSMRIFINNILRSA